MDRWPSILFFCFKSKSLAEYVTASELTRMDLATSYMHEYTDEIRDDEAYSRSFLIKARSL